MSDIYGNTPGTNDRFANGPDEEEELFYCEVCEAELDKEGADCPFGCDAEEEEDDE